MVVAVAKRSTVDTSSIFAGLEKLEDIRVSLSRRMAVAGGAVFRDAAKANAPAKTGKLRGSIYLAYREGDSNENNQVYGISWNAKKAPHGHLVEFGHWRYNKLINGKAQKSLSPGRRRGRGPEDHSGPGALDVPKWVAARPFLGPAFDGNLKRAREHMLTVGQKEFLALLKENSK